MGKACVSDKELTCAANGASRRQRIERVLIAAFSPAELEVIDDSGRHAGHAGAHPDGETHFTVKMRSAAFAGLSRVARQRAVNAALKAEFDAGLHALSLLLTAPNEN